MSSHNFSVLLSPTPQAFKKQNHNILNKLNLSVLFDLLWRIVALRLLLSLLCLLEAEGQPHPHTWNYSEQTFNSPISMQPYLRVHFRVCEYLHVCASQSHTERKEKGNLAQGLYFSLYSTAHEKPLERLKCLCWCCYNCMSKSCRRVGNPHSVSAQSAVKSSNSWEAGLTWQCWCNSLSWISCCSSSDFECHPFWAFHFSTDDQTPSTTVYFFSSASSHSPHRCTAVRFLSWQVGPPSSAQLLSQVSSLSLTALTESKRSICEAIVIKLGGIRLCLVLLSCFVYKV